MSNLGPAETENSSSVSSLRGSPAGASGYFIEPTVLTNTRPGMKVVREEISGPVLAGAGPAGSAPSACVYLASDWIAVSATV